MVAIDPGGTIGVAMLSNSPTITNIYGVKPVPGSGDVYYKVWMDKNPVEVWTDLYNSFNPFFGPVNYVVESFVGSGPRTTESTHTIKQIGYFYYSCIQHHIPVHLATPFARKRYVPWAKQLLKVKASQPQHEMDALAHCRVEWEKVKGGELV